MTEEFVNKPKQGDSDQDILDTLIKDFQKNEGCALVLGPDFFYDNSIDGDKQYKGDDPAKIKYYTNDGFYYISTEMTGRARKEQLEKITFNLRNKKQTDPYKLLAQLPFSLVISLSSDDFICNAYNSINKNYYFYYYKDGNYIPKFIPELKPIKEIFVSIDREIGANSQRPLILNLMGHYSDLDSLIYTHHKFFEYLYSLPIDNLDENVRLNIHDKINSFLILGFQFNKWYLKLIFFLLSKLTKEDSAKTAIFNYNDMNMEEIDFYTRFFKMDFSKSNDKDFIKALHDKCPDELLFNPGPEDVLKQIKSLFEKGMLLQCLEKARNFYGDNQGKLTGLISRYNENESDRNSGIKQSEEHRSERERIRQATRSEIPCLTEN